LVCWAGFAMTICRQSMLVRPRDLDGEKSAA
jgi:hypothetical protein